MLRRGSNWLSSLTTYVNKDKLVYTYKNKEKPNSTEEVLLEVTLEEYKEKEEEIESKVFKKYMEKHRKALEEKIYGSK